MIKGLVRTLTSSIVLFTFLTLNLIELSTLQSILFGGSIGLFWSTF